MISLLMVTEALIYTRKILNMEENILIENLNSVLVMVLVSLLLHCLFKECLGQAMSK